MFEPTSANPPGPGPGSGRAGQLPAAAPPSLANLAPAAGGVRGFTAAAASQSRPRPFRRRRLGAVLATGLALAVGVSASAAGIRRPPQAPPPTKPPVAPPPAKAPPSALLSAADEIARQVATLRGLPQTTPFARGVLSRAEIGLKLRERIAKDYSKDEVQVESAVLKRLGLLPFDADYEKLLFELLTEQVAGFYDPYAKTLYIADWLPLDMQRPALAHEIEHTLQDQHFDLKRFSQPFKEDGDRQLARSAVVEGDGTALMLEFAARGMNIDTTKMPQMVARLGKQMMQMSMAATPALQQAPLVLRESLVFPYVAGLEFVTTHRANQPWSSIDEVFKDPPDSTEQIIHPEKYEQRERPVPITAAPLTTLPGYKSARRDVLGEMLFRVWFTGRLSEAAAAQAAAGWGGDRLVAYTTPGEALPAVLILSAWDSEQDADEAEQAVHKVIVGLTTPPAVPGTHPAKDKDRPRPKAGARDESGAGGTGLLVRDFADREFAVLRRGRLVTIVCGVPKGRAAPVAMEILRTWQVGWPTPAAPTTTPTATPTATPAPARPAGSP